MNILLVYPQYPDTFWSFKHALKFISKKAANPPLGLITISSMLPESWHKKITIRHIVAFLRSVLWLGIFDHYRKQYWKLFFWSFFNRRKLVPLAITYSIYGYHFRKVFKEVL